MSTKAESIKQGTGMAGDRYPLHHRNEVDVGTDVQSLFAFLDDHHRLAGHMETPSLMMAGATMRVETDALEGQAVGSVIRVIGRVLGTNLMVEEVVIERVPPLHKTWETRGAPRLLVIGSYRMGFTISSRGERSRLVVFIDYHLPRRGIAHGLGLLFGRAYATWCTRRMATDAVAAFVGADDPHKAKERGMKAQGILYCFSKWIFVACGIWLIGLGGYFMFARPALLPEDLRYLGSSAIQIESLLPHLASWLRNVFTVMGGFIAGCGVLTTFVGVRVITQCSRGTGIALGCAGLLTVATMSWINFVLGSDFKWLLLMPVVAWLLGLVSYGAGSRTEHAIVAVPQTNMKVQK